MVATIPPCSVSVVNVPAAGAVPPIAGGLARYVESVVPVTVPAFRFNVLEEFPIDVMPVDVPVLMFVLKFALADVPAFILATPPTDVRPPNEPSSPPVKKLYSAGDPLQFVLQTGAPT